MPKDIVIKNNLDIINIQIAIFFKDIENRPDIIGNNLNSKLNNYFNDIPTILPNSESLPISIPFVIYSKDNKKETLQFSRDRCIFICNKEIEMQWNNFIEKFKSIANNIIDLIDFSISRIGIIINSVYFIDNPDEYTIKNLMSGFKLKTLKGIKSSPLETITFSSNSKGTFQGKSINNLISISTGAYLIDNRENKAVRYSIDINTDIKENNLDKNYVSNFINTKLKLFSQKEFEEVFK